MPAIVQVDAMDPVPEWRLKVWAECGPRHRMLAKNREGQYRTVFDSPDKKAATDWWERIRTRQGTDWKGWTWLAYYGWKDGRYGIRKLMLFPQG